VIAEYQGEATSLVEERVRKISDRVLNIVRTAEASRLATNVVADRMARQIISEARAKICI
jgi:hypothetical protein